MYFRRYKLRNRVGILTDWSQFLTAGDFRQFPRRPFGRSFLPALRHGPGDEAVDLVAQLDEVSILVIHLSLPCLSHLVIRADGDVGDGSVDVSTLVGTVVYVRI